jgi:hypothetical protein
MNKKPDIKELVKNKTFVEYHPEPDDPERNFFIQAFTAPFSSDYCYITSRLRQNSGHFQHPLVETDVVCYTETASYFLLLPW